MVDTPDTAQNRPDHDTSATVPEPDPSVFTLIIRGDLPGRFVWRDDTVVAFMTIAPIRPGHVLVVPIEQVDHWIDVDPEVWAHMAEVQRVIATAQMEAFAPNRIGSIIAGLEVPHCHVHLIPIESEADLDFAKADPNPDAASLDAHAESLRAALRAIGRTEVPGA